VPFSNVVPLTLSLRSSSPSLMTGKLSVDQITVEDAPGRRDETFLAISSILTTARPDPSWPVTTRRIFKLMGRFLVELFLRRAEVRDGFSQRANVIARPDR